MRNRNFKRWLGPVGWAIVGLLGVGGCQPDDVKKEAKIARVAKPSVQQFAPIAAVAKVARPPFVGYHRYRGTVGGQPVTVVLTIDSKSEEPLLLLCTGSYCYDRHPSGQLLLSTPQPYQPQRPLLLAEADEEKPQQPTGRWQATQAAGPVLTGTWTSPTGRQLPFSLHEDYTDGHGQLMAVRYDIVVDSVKGDPCQPEREEGETKADYRQRLQNLPATSLDRQYLHLLGTEAKRPALRQLQCPSPRERRASMKADLKQAGDCVTITDGLGVTYNEYGLLATYEYHEEFYQGTPHAMHHVEKAIYDLGTGATLVLADIMKPGTDHALRQLITPKLQHELELEVTEVLHPAGGDSTTTELPRAGVGLVVDGLEFQYSDYELGAYAYGMPSIVLTWAELLPLLRPDSPVARMLRERGLWRASKK